MTKEDLQANRLLNYYFNKYGNSIIAQNEALIEVQGYIDKYILLKDKNKEEYWNRVKEELEEY